MSPTHSDRSPSNLEFTRPSDPGRLERVLRALAELGFAVELAESGAAARERVLELLPLGAEVHTARSETLRELGLAADIDESGRYDSVRARLKGMDRSTQGREMRKLGAAPDFILGSAHAVTEDGQLLVASGTGSQLSPYAYAAGSVVLIVGHQKIVRDVDEGLRRIREYCLPMEDRKMRAQGSSSVWAERLMLHFDPRRRVRVILVRESLGT
ncbi:MAG: hypothetical protein FJ207_07695 [Gemmatimonadetes bacterium]|nr:hypothetical protein [Gemmatimonadota bacterium]